MARSDPWLLTCLGVAHDLPLLPHWLDHYLGLGIAPDRVIVILNAAEAGDPGLDAATDVLRAARVSRPPVRWIAPYTSGSMWTRRGEVQAQVCDPDDWVLHADVDEFHRWPEPVEDMLARARELDADCMQGVMIDRLASDGALAPVRAAPPILAQFPVRAALQDVFGRRGAPYGRGGTVKLMAGRARHRPARGGHRALPEGGPRYLYGAALDAMRSIDRPAVRFAVPTQVDHVHWTDTLPDRLARRLATPGVSPAGAAYGRDQLDYLAARGGRIDLRDAWVEGRDGAADAWRWPGDLARLRRRGRAWRMAAPALAATDRVRWRLEWALQR